MDTQTLMRFRNLFEIQKNQLLLSRQDLQNDLVIEKDDLFDEMDITNTEMETSMRVRMRNRESLFLRKINQALERIREGTFGECTCCGDDIEIKRLEARPTATLCVNCKEMEERKERIFEAGHRSKSLGRRVLVIA